MAKVVRHGAYTKLSKRAQHKADVEARKDQPFTKRRKQRRKPLPFPEDFFTMAREKEREGVLMTRVERKPPRWFLEHADANGVVINGALAANPKSREHGYTLMLEGGGIHEFKTQRKALAFFSRLQKVDPVEDHMKDGLGNPIRPGGTIANATDEQLAVEAATGSEVL
jgi:hypothetical protein